MTKQELLVVLKAAAQNADTESAHGAADDALLDLINDDDIRAAYDAVPKWYA